MGRLSTRRWTDGGGEGHRALRVTMMNSDSTTQPPDATRRGDLRARVLRAVLSQTSAIDSELVS